MKKLILLAIFSVGLFTVSNAQFLAYTIDNQSPAVWDYGMAHTGSATPVYELNILPGQVRTGFVSNFAFLLEFKAENSNNCGGYQAVLGAPAAGLVPLTCPAIVTSFSYNVVALWPGVVYTLDIVFN